MFIVLLLFVYWLLQTYKSITSRNYMHILLSYKLLYISVYGCFGKTLNPSTSTTVLPNDGLFCWLNTSMIMICVWCNLGHMPVICCLGYTLSICI